MSLAGNLTPEQLEQLAEATFSSNKSLNLGPFILGSVIDALLCGILLMQCGTYIGLSSQDNRLLKVTITYVVAMNLWSTSFAWAWVWDLFVRNFGTYRSFLSVKYMLNRNRLFGVVLSTLMLTSVGSGLAIKILCVQQMYTINAAALKVPGYICLCSTVAVDIAITTTILWYILSWRGVNQRTNHLLKKIARVTFESQLPPTLVAIAILAIYTVQPASFILTPLIWLQPKVYGISILHTLNMRPEMAQSTVVFGTNYTAPSRTMGNVSLQFAVGSVRTTQTEEADAVPRNHAIDVSRSRSYFSTQNKPQKPMVISFDESVLTTSDDIPKPDAAPVISHSESSDMEMEVVGSKSNLRDLEARMTTAG
ncbi:hypothetical protein FRC08_015933 [Ceratobasidium sp. 394]|nr:hypothetical protein FRC08_015933 [Ceratobasidium sp. 394]